ncbi:MAG: peptidase M64 [Alloprevotella sp.]|nr:peptidase M64 [Alloprevotella sp.]
MKKLTLTLLAIAAANIGVCAQSLDFGRTLRVDYIFSGDVARQEISVSELTSFKGWAGRRQNLDRLPLKGNGQITMADARTGNTLYCHSFSTLFQEWLNSEEATHTRKAFENVFLLPMPTDSARITVRLLGNHERLLAEYTHTVRPADILLRPLDGLATAPHRYILQSGSAEECIDVAMVAEGYTADEADDFYAKAQEASDALFAHEPFKHLKNRFNIVAVALPSQDSGVSIPGQGVWKQTALGSQFNTFYSDRYLTTLNLRRLNDALAGIPYEHIIILANTDNYGGGGIYNSYTLSMTKHHFFRPVVVHEFGHSFAGLADEYFYDDQYTQFYYADTEPWEQNLTTLKDFQSKWADMLPEGTPVPTPATKSREGAIGVYEGGGYQSKGVYRPFQECRMKINEWPEFCAVCQRAIECLVDFYAPGK